jgi:hypothetical protein
MNDELLVAEGVFLATAYFKRWRTLGLPNPEGHHLLRREQIDRGNHE